ncbi:MAG: methyltransferase domain-containing protein [Chloroflexi bacterium]|nr:MAG: methyltransferase domain-containing protein [Chloroflexota bacterium]MBL1193621.1 methyltransferase domain-containing protein [Chloroflexota bacterium]NOH10913.1 arsenite methyltransferase [Chloroflexota bacterium]
MTKTKENVHADVQDFYAERARNSDSCCGSGEPRQTDYNLLQLGELPADVANFSLGCGDPITFSELQAGETVLDLGSGGGLDCFLAAKEVGETGSVIGVDMTPDMLQKARDAAKRMEVSNVDFREGYLEDLPVEDNSVDVVISNCVINLSPDKSQVFNEIYRTLKPGGRVAVSDIVSQGELPESIKNDAIAWSACAAGALPAEEFAGGLEAAGFVDVSVKAKNEANDLLDEMPSGILFSALISARKPSEG